MSVGNQFIGTYKCTVCQCRVRVYDWLPDTILCSKCLTKEFKHEQLED